MQEEVGSGGECDIGLRCGQERLFVVNIILALFGSCPKSSALLSPPKVEVWKPSCQSVSWEESSTKFTWRERMPWQCGIGGKSDRKLPCPSLSITQKLNSFLSFYTVWTKVC